MYTTNRVYQTVIKPKYASLHMGLIYLTENLFDEVFRVLSSVSNHCGLEYARALTGVSLIQEYLLQWLLFLRPLDILLQMLGCINLCPIDQ